MLGCFPIIMHERWVEAFLPLVTMGRFTICVQKPVPYVPLPEGWQVKYSFCHVSPFNLYVIISDGAMIGPYKGGRMSMMP